MSIHIEKRNPEVIVIMIGAVVDGEDRYISGAVTKKEIAHWVNPKDILGDIVYKMIEELITK